MLRAVQVLEVVSSDMHVLHWNLMEQDMSIGKNVSKIFMHTGACVNSMTS